MKVHLIGIGGTGMGAVAGLLRAAGHEVRGSDTAVYPPMSEQLAALGIPYSEGFAAENLAWGPDAVVVGNVNSKDHVEVVEAEVEIDVSGRAAPLVLGAEVRWSAEDGIGVQFHDVDIDVLLELNGFLASLTGTESSDGGGESAP